MTGIAISRLNEIEAGSDATMAELRDIARSLSISVATLQGRSYFDSQVAELDDFVRLYKGEKVVGLSGFWGHIGILLNNTDKYVWYPVTSETRDMVYRMMSKERIVVPCMNNRLLFLNMDNVKEIILLDEACDEPACANWDPKVSCGEIPAVVFEALEDYMYDEDENMSPRFREYLERIIKGQGWSKDDINAIVNYAVIHFADGTKQFEEIQFDGNESITSEISTVYDFEDSEFSEDVLFFNHMDESERMINMKNIAMLEIPLAQIERAMSKVMDELEA